MQYVLQPVQGDEACMQLSWPRIAVTALILKCDKMLAFFPQNKMHTSAAQYPGFIFKARFYLTFYLFTQVFTQVLPNWQQHCSIREGTVAQQAVV